MSIDSDFVAYYKPLVRDFCNDPHLPVDHLGGITEPFLPAFGDLYEQASPRVVFIGMETRGWGHAEQFVQQGRRDPGIPIRAGLEDFRQLPFVKWGNNFGTAFWDAVFFILATLHSLDDWKVLKRRMNDGVLRSFAWGNCNAIERYAVTAGLEGASKDAWQRVKTASLRFDRFEHIVRSLAPDVAVVMYWGMEPRRYLHGLNCEISTAEKGLRHFVVDGVHIFNVPHPRSMSYSRGHKKEYFAARLRALFERNGLLFQTPQFIDHAAESDQYLRGLKQRAPTGMDKYRCVEWIAEQLHEEGRVMSGACLASVLNDLGHCTNYNSVFIGGRGIYRLIRSVYKRCEADPEHANMVACAFVKRNGQYAYS